jgi:hypothetical protein
MRILVSICVVFFTCSLSASAQTSTLSRWNRYLFFASGAGTIGDFGGSSGRANIHAGAGAEVFLYKGWEPALKLAP